MRGCVADEECVGLEMDFLRRVVIGLAFWLGEKGVMVRFKAWSDGVMGFFLYTCQDSGEARGYLQEIRKRRLGFCSESRPV